MIYLLVRATVLVGLSLATELYGQEALVVTLTSEETSKARELHAALVAAEKNWADFQRAIQERYGPDLAKAVGDQSKLLGIRGTVWPASWARGIEFSKDFRFAVPVSEKSKK